MTNAVSTSDTNASTSMGSPDAVRIVRAGGQELLDAASQFILRRTQEDYGYGYIAKWHWDMDAARETYENTPGQALWVALAPSDETADPEQTPGTLDVVLPGQTHRERIVGTAAIRAGGPKGELHPPELIAKYGDPTTTAQIVRVMIAPEARRRGLASRFVALATEFTREAGYERLYLHTNALVPGAVEFWRRHAVEVYDARGTAWDSDPRFETIHFEIPLHG